MIIDSTHASNQRKVKQPVPSSQKGNHNARQDLLHNKETANRTNMKNLPQQAVKDTQKLAKSLCTITNYNDL